MTALLLALLRSLKALYDLPFVKPALLALCLGLIATSVWLYVQKGYYSHQLTNEQQKVGTLQADVAVCKGNVSTLEGAIDEQNAALELAKEKAKGVVAQKKKEAAKALSEPLPVYEDSGAEALNNWLLGQ